MPRAKFLTMDSEPERPTRIYTDVKTTEARRHGDSEAGGANTDIHGC